ncbi:MAG: class I SAM-dependent methyltransferase [Chitinophagaceae bacterium]
MPINTTLTTEYFDDVYARKDDPWDFETSEYEKNKYADTVAALSKESYETGFEIGCSIGVLTSMLATKVKKLLAVDVSDVALDKARKRLSENGNVEFRKMSVPAELPDQKFDLIIVSEVGYYLSKEDLLKMRKEIVQHLNNGASLLLVHWLPVVHDYPLTGDQVHEAFYDLTRDNPQLKIVTSSRKEKYRLDLFEKI